MIQAALDALVERRPITAAVALVVAHPDDETIGAGASLHLFRDLLLIHVTDGAPRNLADAHAAGFTTCADYAAERRVELSDALELSGWSGRCRELGVPDQGATEQMGDVANQLAALLQANNIELVLTHAYEGGHPDHDATAFAVHAAAARSIKPPHLIEFAAYHADADGGIATGCFLPNGSPAVHVLLDERERRRKRSMLDCFATQAKTLAPFGTAAEAFRPAPRYHFAKPPHAGPLHYERYDWGMTGDRWRTYAADIGV